MFLTFIRFLSRQGVSCVLQPSSLLYVSSIVVSTSGFIGGCRATNTLYPKYPKFRVPSGWPHKPNGC